MWQSSHLVKALPALFGALVLTYTLPPAALQGQDVYRLKWNENFRREPDPQGVLLAFVQEGTDVAVTGRQEAWLQVTLEGWIWARSVRADARDGHDLVVSASNGENLRAEPNGQRLARLSTGALLDEVERQGGWVRVRRTGWIFGQSLERVQTAATAPPPPDGTTERRNDGTGAAVGLDRAVTRDSTSLYRIPDGPPVGKLDREAPVKVLARSGGWVRIQTEGWIREDDLKPSAPGVLVGVSAAELRSRPEEFVGKVLQWTLQFIAVKSPDDLRPDVPEGRPYVLARGPQPEQGFVYLIVTDAQLARFRQVPELATIVILGRVRVARSRYLQVPVLDLIEMQAK